MAAYIDHGVPGYPVMNIETAKSALAKHEGCDAECAAKSYYSKLVPRLERSLFRDSVATSWNMWTTD
ncbi:hypothetical protein [Nocardia sp. NPDC005978]|uniref:hypothetical protein n=1 Tax=unclassified Nocardia TaxID=2637762 RepID=UPI0033A77DF1